MTEIDRLLVRLVGDGTDFEDMLREASDASGRAARDITRHMDGTRQSVALLSVQFVRLGASIKAAGKKIGLAGAVMSAAVTAPITLIGNSAINAASDLKESFNAMEVVFKENSAELKKLGETSADTWGMSTTEFNQFSVKFSGFAKKVAGDGGDIVGVMKDITGRVADFASVHNVEMAEAGRIFQSTMAGETEPIRRFGKDLSARAVELYALETGLIKAGEKMTASIKTVATYNLLMRETAEFHGDFANTSTDMANASRRSGAAMKNLSAEIGEILLPIKMRLMSVQSLLIGRFIGMSKESKALVVKLALVAAAIGPLLTGFGLFLVLGGAVITTLGKMGLAFSIMAKKATIAWASATLGVSLLISALIALGFGFYNLQKKTGVFDPLIASSKELWKSLKASLMPVFQDFKKLLTEDLMPVFNDVIAIYGELIVAAAPVIVFFGKIFVFVIKGFVLQLKALIGAISLVVKGLGWLAKAGKKTMEFFRKEVEKPIKAPKIEAAKIEAPKVKAAKVKAAAAALTGDADARAKDIKEAAKAEAKRQKEIKKLEDDINSMGYALARQTGSVKKSAEEWRIHDMRMRATAMGLSANIKEFTELERLLKLKNRQEAIKEFNESTRDATIAIHQQTMALVLGNEEYQRQKLALDATTAGVKDFSKELAELDRANAMYKLAQDMDAAKSAGKALTESHATAVDRLAKQIAEVIRLRDLGVIGPKTYKREITAIDKELKRIQDEGKVKVTFEFTGLDAGSLQDMRDIEQQIAAMSEVQIDGGAVREAKRAEFLRAGLRGKVELPAQAKPDKDEKKKSEDLLAQIARNTDPRVNKLKIEGANL